MSKVRTRRHFLGTAVASSALLAASRAASASDRASTRSTVPAVTALTFDVFGTVVDWRTSIIREGQLLSKRKGLVVDWPKFADAWRAGYGPAMNRVRKGEIPWSNIDRLHRMILDELLPQFGLRELTEAELTELNLAWHRLMPWPDAVAGLTRLRTRFITATLSNGNVGLLVNMAKNAGLPWDCVLSAEMTGHYKPDPQVYQTAVKLLGLQPSEVMMVAAHRNDLIAARKLGLKTAFVSRPLEFGPERKPDEAPEVDVTASDFLDLATKIGA